MICFEVQMLTRKRVAELMDDPGLGQTSHVEALQGLERLNLISKSADILCGEIEKLERRPERTLRILDLATGAGDVPIKLFKRLQNKIRSIEIVATDISQTAVDYATKRAQKQKADIKFLKLDALREPLPSNFDVVMTSLFTHHLDPPEVIALLQKMGAAASQLVLVNDLVRSDIALKLVWLGSRVFSRSPIVHFDGPASVHASFTTNELRSMAEQAGLKDCSVKSCPPCRQLLVWKPL
jgi:SAM-dependent methyltransferase